MVQNIIFQRFAIFSFLFVSTWISSFTFSLSIEATPSQLLGLAKVRSDTMTLETIIVVDIRIYLYTLLSYHLTRVVRTIHTLYMSIGSRVLMNASFTLEKLIRYIKFQQLISHNHLWSLSQRWLKVELNSLFATCNIWSYTKPTKQWWLKNCVLLLFLKWVLLWSQKQNLTLAKHASSTSYEDVLNLLILILSKVRGLGFSWCDEGPKFKLWSPRRN